MNILQICSTLGLSLCFGLAWGLEQPTQIPGKYLITDQHFPPLETVVNREQQAFPVYGIYCWLGEYKMLRQETKDVGWKTFRISGPLSDADLAMIYEDGINFSFMLGGPELDGKKQRRDDFETDDAYIQASVKAAHLFFDKYGSGGSFYASYPQFKDRYIPFMQLRNEPNFHYMYKNGSEAEREALYAELAPLLADVVRSRSPQTKIIGFTAGGAGAGDMRFVQHVLEKNPKALTEVDVFATHPYVHPVAPETNKVHSWGSYSIANSLHTLRKNFALYGRKNIPVWYTEGGWMISKKDGAAYEKPEAECVSLELQAAYSCRYYALALRLGVDCVTNMFITDTDGYPGGFFDRLRENAWRPSAKAVQNMIRVMPHPGLIAAQSDGENTNYIYEFKSDALKENCPTVIMAYRVEGPKTVAIKVNWVKAEIIDMLGESTEALIVDGVISTEIGALPIYIREKK